MARNTAISRTGVDSARSMQLAETSAMAMAEREKHKIQARYQVAMMMRRNLEDVRIEILEECKRPGFAAVARYNKPVGGGIQGPSIRFVECAIALMGNMDSLAQVVYDDDDKRLVEVSVTDIERNTSHSKTITVTKTVERRSPTGRLVLKERKNNFGDTVYEVVATDDELMNKEASLVSKAIRTCGLRLLPKWLTDEAMEKCQETSKRRDAKDPDRARREMVDAWAEMGIKASDIEAYLGHPIKQMNADEQEQVRGLYNAIQANETTWASVMEHRDNSGSDTNGESVVGPSSNERSIDAYDAVAAPIRAAMLDEENPKALAHMYSECKQTWVEHGPDTPFSDEIAAKRMTDMGLKAD